jgi:phage baseplate assembly protein gpV
MFPHFFWGKVTDNADPDGLNRVRVSKLAEEEGVTEWIPVLTSNAGDDAGLSFLPEVDDQVLVVSLDSFSVSKAVLGSIWSNGAAPPQTGENSGADLNQDGKNSLKFIKSRSGSMVIFDDSEGAEKIQLISPDGESRLDLSVADELLSLATEKDLAVGAKGAVAIQAEEISMTSKKQLNMETDEHQISAKKAMNITADQDVGIKGSGLSLN